MQNISGITELRPFLLAGSSLFLATLTAGVILTSFMCRLSRRLGAVDKPNGQLKRHRRPTPTLGGIPLYLSFLLALLVLWAAGRDLPPAAGWLPAGPSLAALLTGGLIILILGIGDDLRHVMPRFKLLFQIIASLVIMASGLVIRRCDFFGVFEIHLGLLAVPFTLFWLVGSCNAFNFIDGMDGLASGIGAVMALLLAVLGFMTGQFGAALIALALAGSMIGVLAFNIKPAMIFLGDSGSQLIGLLLGALTVKIATTAGVFALPCAGLILSVPVLDALLSILRRWSRRQSLVCGDRAHIHHCLRRLGLTVNQVSMTLWMAVALLGGFGILFRFSRGYQTGLAALTLVLLQLYVAIRLGCLDLRQLAGRIIGFDKSNHSLPAPVQTVPPARSAAPTVRQMAELETLWEKMKPLFEKMPLDRAILTLEGVSADGRTRCETYRWVRSEATMADLLLNQWTRRFALDDEHRRIATLRLESTEKLRRDEERIEWLLKQIRENMHADSNRKSGLKVS